MQTKNENISPENYKSAGNEKFHKNQFREALECYDLAIQIKPDYKEAWLNKGLCHRQLNELEQAKAAFKKAWELDPNYEKARYNYKSLLQDTPTPVHSHSISYLNKLSTKNKFQTSSIDLHGLSEEEAKRSVINRIKDAESDGINRLRFITGRGNHVNARGQRGTLYQSFRDWLSDIHQNVDQVHQYDGYYEVEIHNGRTIHDPILRSMDDHMKKFLLDNIEIIKKNAEKGSAEDLFALAGCYQHGIGVPQDYEKMTNIFIKLADAGDPIAQYEAACSYFIGRGIRLNDELTRKYLKAAADQNYALAELMLGNIYWRGTGVAVDYTMAYTYLIKAANHGQGEAARKVGCFHAQGFDGTVNNQAALSWWELADKLQDGPASYNLYMTYLTGKGDIKPNQNKAYHYLKNSAHYHDPDGEFAYGIALISGHHYTKDEKTGLTWLKQAMDNQSKDAAFFLFLYHIRDGFEHSRLEEIKSYLVRAAELGHILAEFMVVTNAAVFQINEAFVTQTREELFKKSEDKIFAVIHSTKMGHDVIDLFLDPKNTKKQIKKGIHLLRKLSEKNDIEAIQKLYTIFLKGDLVDVNPTEAHKYLLQGASLEDPQCLCTLGYFWQDGLGGIVNDAKAFAYFKRAAVKNDANSHNQLGIFYHRGRFVKASVSDAEYHFRQAMVLDDPKKRSSQEGENIQRIFGYASFNLATMLLELSGRQDEALSLLKMSTEDEHPDAPYVLAIMYKKQGDKQHFLYYLLVANRRGCAIAKNIVDEICQRSQITPEYLFEEVNSFRPH